MIKKIRTQRHEKTQVIQHSLLVFRSCWRHWHVRATGTCVHNVPKTIKIIEKYFFFSVSFAVVNNNKRCVSLNVMIFTLCHFIDNFVVAVHTYILSVVLFSVCSRIFKCFRGEKMLWPPLFLDHLRRCYDNLCFWTNYGNKKFDNAIPLAREEEILPCGHSDNRNDVCLWCGVAWRNMHWIPNHANDKLKPTHTLTKWMKKSRKIQ